MIINPRLLSLPVLVQDLSIFGNGGFFSITGIFWDKKLGLYRAFVTNEKNSIVLKFIDKVIVISPDNPQDMITNLTILLLSK